MNRTAAIVCVRVRPNKRSESCRVLISRWKLFRVMYTHVCFAFFGLCPFCLPFLSLVYLVFLPCRPYLVLPSFALPCLALPCIMVLRLLLACLALSCGCLVVALPCRVAVLSYLVLGRACLLFSSLLSLLFSCFLFLSFENLWDRKTPVLTLAVTLHPHLNPRNEMTRDCDVVLREPTRLIVLDARLVHMSVIAEKVQYRCFSLLVGG